MGRLLPWRIMEPVLEWVLLLAVGASALCMLALATMLVVGRYRMHRNRKTWERLSNLGEARSAAKR
jgi:hypothetical protein